MNEKHYLIVAEHDGEHKPYSKYTTLENAIAFAETTRQKGFTVQLFQKIDTDGKTPTADRILTEVLVAARRAVTWATVNNIHEPWVKPLTEAVTNFDEMAPRGSDAT